MSHHRSFDVAVTLWHILHAAADVAVFGVR